MYLNVNNEDSLKNAIKWFNAVIELNSNPIFSSLSYYHLAFITFYRDKNVTQSKEFLKKFSEYQADNSIDAGIFNRVSEDRKMLNILFDSAIAYQLDDKTLRKEIIESIETRLKGFSIASMQKFISFSETSSIEITISCGVCYLLAPFPLFFDYLSDKINNMKLDLLECMDESEKFKLNSFEECESIIKLLLSCKLPTTRSKSLLAEAYFCKVFSMVNTENFSKESKEYLKVIEYLEAVIKHDRNSIFSSISYYYLAFLTYYLNKNETQSREYLKKFSEYKSINQLMPIFLKKFWKIRRF